MERQGQEQRDIYPPLDPDSRQIRLFTLQKGAFGDPIEGFLSLVTLGDDLNYEALSYVWGDPNITLPISVNGIEFGVTTNLEHALRYLRLKDSPRRLWIDAICINQSSLLERNHQVKNMKLIYQAASAVLAWLGRFNVGTKEGLRVLSALMQNDYDAEEFEQDRHHKAGQYLVEIFNNTYWKRVWVIQEIALAKRVFLHCGPFSAEIPSSGCLKRTTQNLKRLDGMGPYGQHAMTIERRAGFNSRKKRLLSILKLREERLVSQLPCLYELVWQFRHWESHDPRDMVFALLGLVSEQDAIENSPNYSLSLSQVNNRLVHSYILRYKDLNILSYVNGLPASIHSLSPRYSLEDFDNALEERHAIHLIPLNSSQGSQFREFNASKDSSPILGSELNSDLSLDSHHVTLRGFVIDRIEYLSGRYQYNSLSSHTRDKIKEPITRLNVNYTRQGYGSSLRFSYVRYRLLYQWKLLQGWKHQALLSPKTNCSSQYIFTCLENRLNSFWRTIIADSITYEGMITKHGGKDAANQIMRGTRPEAGSWYGQMIDIITSDELPVDANNFFDGIKGSPGLDDICWAIELAVINRAFFLSEAGLMGLGPRPLDTQQGDVIGIILGGATPFVLRPLGQNLYQLVGECYVHGIMDGEAMVDLANGLYKLQDIVLVSDKF